jgi:hypothetical protein
MIDRLDFVIVFSVKIMAEKLDPEQLGVITFNSFVDEFFPSTSRTSDAIPSFTVFHYNGLQRSSANKVCSSVDST